MLFFFKKLLSRFLFPVPLVLELLLAGLLIQRFSKRKRTGKTLVGAGIVLLICFGYGIGTEQYLRSLERNYPPLHAEQLEDLPPDTDIVVLGQGLADEAGLPANSRVNEVFLVRIIEAVRIHRIRPDTQICVSVAGDLPIAEKRAFLEGMAEIVGLSPEVFVLLDGARDTADEVQLALEQVRGSYLIVVSSASHLRRALRIFDGSGVEAVPAPCGYELLRSKGLYSPANHFPNAGKIERSERAIYELLGNIWEMGKRTRED